MASASITAKLDAPRLIYVGDTVAVSGSVHGGAGWVTLERAGGRADKWAEAGRAKLNGRGAFSFEVKMRTAGGVRLRVRYGSSRSAALSVQVRKTGATIVARPTTTVLRGGVVSISGLPNGVQRSALQAA